MRTYYVYIITNNKSSTVLYVGITSNLAKRIEEHKDKLVKGFSKKYNLNRLVYVEQYRDVKQALEREKQLKRWHRQWKLNLIRRTNPDFKDLTNQILK